MGKKGKVSQASTEVIPDELRCKRSDGKQWRCTGRAVEGKSMCEKHIVQAKKRTSGGVTTIAKPPAPKRHKGEEQTKHKVLNKSPKGGGVPKKRTKTFSSDSESESEDDSEGDSDSPSYSPPSKHNNKDVKAFPLHMRRSNDASAYRVNDPGFKRVDKFKKNVGVERGESSLRKVMHYDDTDGSEEDSDEDSDDFDFEERKVFDKKIREKSDSLHQSKVREKMDDFEKKVRFEDDLDEKGVERKVKTNREEYERRLKQRLQNQDRTMKENEGTRKGLGSKEELAKKIGRRYDDDTIDDFRMKTRPKADDSTRKFKVVLQLSGTSAKQSAYHEFNEMVRNNIACTNYRYSQI